MCIYIYVYIYEYMYIYIYICIFIGIRILDTSSTMRGNVFFNGGVAWHLSTPTGLVKKGTLSSLAETKA